MKKTTVLCIMIALVFTPLMLKGCSDETASLFFLTPPLSTIRFQGYLIPQFPTSREQLNYAKSGFTDPEEKKAALKMVFQSFPDARLECGHAALMLAYMNLGFDYRFASLKDCENAVADFHEIIGTYTGYPLILVKAYWYLGWIQSDLLQDKKKGLPFFWHIVKNYPGLPMGISSPVPWVSLVTPMAVQGKTLKKERPNKSWAGIALLEIIRHASHKDEIFNAFDILWENYRNSIPTGLALKWMLADDILRPRAIPHINPYLSLNIANPYLAEELAKGAVKNAEDTHTNPEKTMGEY